VSDGSAAREISHQFVEFPLPILAVEKVAHRPSPRFVRFYQSLAFVGVHAVLRQRGRLFGFAARWAAVGKAGLVRLQFELFPADSANSDRKYHHPMIQPGRILLDANGAWPSEAAKLRHCQQWNKFGSHAGQPGNRDGVL